MPLGVSTNMVLKYPYEFDDEHCLLGGSMIDVQLFFDQSIALFKFQNCSLRLLQRLNFFFIYVYLKAISAVFDGLFLFECEVYFVTKDFQHSVYKRYIFMYKYLCLKNVGVL